MCLITKLKFLEDQYSSKLKACRKISKERSRTSCGRRRVDVGFTLMALSLLAH